MNSVQRKKACLKTLKDLGGKATTREIAERLELNLNGVSQTLGRMSEVRCLPDEGKGGDIPWVLVLD